MSIRTPLTCYDKQGIPISVDKWVELIEDPSYRIIKQEIVNGYRVLTIWLGLDHSFTGNFPLIFETIIFGGIKDYTDEFDEYQKRYSTEAAALAGHEAACKVAEVLP